MVYINSDNLVTLSGVIYDSAYINDAEVSGELIDRVSGDSITTFEMDYVSASNGNYQGVIPHDTAMTEDQRLLVVVTVEADSYQDEFRLNEVAGYNRLS